MENTNLSQLNTITVHRQCCLSLFFLLLLLSLTLCSHRRLRCCCFILKKILSFHFRGHPSGNLFKKEMVFVHMVQNDDETMAVHQRKWAINGTALSLLLELYHYFVLTFKKRGNLSNGCVPSLI